MDLEPDAMAGAVQVPLAVARTGEQIAAGAVDGLRLDARGQCVDSGTLGRLDERVDLPLCVRWLADHIRTGHVGVVAVDEGADVDDHRVALDDRAAGGVVVGTRRVLGP